MSTTTHDWHAPQADPTADAEQTAAAYLSVALAVAQAHVTRRTARAAAATDDTGRAVSAARDGYGPVLGPRQADGPTALAAWHAAAPYAETLPDAATALDRAESALRRSSPTAMLRYDTLVFEGVTPAQAMRTASVDMPQAAGQEAEPAAPEVRYRAAVHAALDANLADAVLADTSWPALAGALDLAAADAGTDPVRLLADVAAQRELGTASHPASVLRYRLNPTPNPAQVLAVNYPQAISDTEPRQGKQSAAYRPAPAQTRSRSRRR